MPTKYGYKKGRRPYARRSYVRKGLSRKERTQVKRIVRNYSETKFLGTTALTNLTDSPVYIDISVIAQGVQDAQRIGEKVSLEGIRLNYRLLCGDEHNTVRVMLVQFLEDSAYTTIDMSNILNPAAISPLTALHRYLGPPTVRVLYDRVHGLVGDGVTSGGSGTTAVIAPYGPRSLTDLVKVWIPRKRLRRLEYQGTTVEGEGKLYLVLLSDSAAISLVHPSISYDCVVSYKDA